MMLAWRSRVKYLFNGSKQYGGKPLFTELSGTIGYWSRLEPMALGVYVIGRSLVRVRSIKVCLFKESSHATHNHVTLAVTWVAHSAAYIWLAAAASTEVDADSNSQLQSIGAR